MSTAVKKKTGPIRRLGSQSMKDYLQTRKKPTRVIGPMERHLMTRPLDMSRRQDIMHPSEITKEDWCIRAEYSLISEARKGNIPEPERPGLILQSIFDTGHAAHSKYQNYLAEMGVLYGSWHCVPCGAKWGPSTDGVCAQCRDVATYDELKLYSSELLIEGHTDGWVTLDPEGILEVKTIGTGTIRAGNPQLLYDNDGSLEKAFADIRSPFPDHRRQAQVYLWLAHDMYDEGIFDREPPESMIVLYECKANQQIKEFTVQYRPDQIEDVLKNARKVVKALQKGKAPKCNHGGCDKCEMME